MIFRLDSTYLFPDPGLAEADGLLAVGGDLHPERLLQAYRHGIFPWFSRGHPYLWWSPDPRLVLFPAEFRASHSLRQSLRNGRFRVTFNQDFPAVIEHCAAVRRPGQLGTWITGGMKKSYISLFTMGFALSVEVWDHDGLAGGLYGVSLPGVFFGESMFHLKRDASKVALAALVGKCLAEGTGLIDCQLRTEHLVSLGAREISREKYLLLLRKALKSKGSGS